MRETKRRRDRRRRKDGTVGTKGGNFRANTMASPLHGVNTFNTSCKIIPSINSPLSLSSFSLLSILPSSHSPPILPLSFRSHKRLSTPKHSPHSPSPQTTPHNPSRYSTVASTNSYTAGYTSNMSYTGNTGFAPPAPVQNTVIVQQPGQSVYVQQQVWSGCGLNGSGCGQDHMMSHDFTVSTCTGISRWLPDHHCPHTICPSSSAVCCAAASSTGVNVCC